MNDVLVPIDSAGRIVLPKGIRQELGIQTGDVFKVSIHGTTVSLLPSKAKTGFVRKGRALIFSTNGKAVLDQAAVGAILEESREEHIHSLAGKIVGRK